LLSCCAVAVDLAGGTLLHFLGVMSIGQLYLEHTFLTLAILAVGGLGSLLGALLGCLVNSAAFEVLRLVNGAIGLGIVAMPPLLRLRKLCLAAARLSILLYRVSAIMGGRYLGVSLVPKRCPTATAALSSLATFNAQKLTQGPRRYLTWSYA